jgi:hypothetical protein
VYKSGPSQLGAARSGLPARLDEPTFVGEDDKLGSVAHPEFHHGPVDVGLDSERREVEAFGDVVVAQASGNERCEFAFAWGEVVEPFGFGRREGPLLVAELGQQTARRSRGEQRLTEAELRREYVGALRTAERDPTTSPPSSNSWACDKSTGTGDGCDPPQK